MSRVIKINNLQTLTRTRACARRATMGCGLGMGPVISMLLIIDYRLIEILVLLWNFVGVMAGVLRARKYSFDAENYLKSRFSNVNVPGRILFPLECFHEAFQCLPSSLKVLDYGAGPVIMSIISAARTASEIVLSDLAESNLEALRKWLRRDAEAFDWSPYFDHVVQTLEGKGEEEAREREERLRETVKDVAYCNIEEDPPIRTTCPGPYDVIIDSGTLTASSRSKEMFEVGVRKIVGLLKPGGTLLSFTSDRNMDGPETGTYTIGCSQHHSVFNTSCQYFCEVLKRQGFGGVTAKTYSLDEAVRQFYDNRMVGFKFITANKV